MSLSRLQNFLRASRGTIVYLDSGNVDATDSITNDGSSPLSPFVTLQRALLQAARNSYQKGLNNDRFARTTIVVSPGEYWLDNRPGYIVASGSNNYLLRSGAGSNDFPAFDVTSNFDITDSNNQLYKLNSVFGGIIIPRGTSIVGTDMRKCIFRPLYVPNPENDDIERSCILRVTGASYVRDITFYDASPNHKAYYDYTSNGVAPNFSHHKLSCLEYVDGVNPINIQDNFLSYSTDRTDLEMYYEKVGLGYGSASGRPIEPDYPSSSIDIQPKVDEYRIVAPFEQTVGISSIFAGDGTLSTTLITVTTDVEVFGLEIDTAFQIQGVSAEYDGQFIVYNKLNATTIQYQAPNAPTIPSPAIAGASLSLVTETVTSSSPFVSKCSLRSVYGLCGLLADGDKVSGFRSFLVDQFTGISLQKDDNAFVKYNTTTGLYDSGIANLYSDSYATYKPSYEHFHIKAINDAYIQNVSVFAIGYANQFVAENGGDQSVNNSVSNFGSKALVSSGFKKSAFGPDDVGYITHVIPPKEIDTNSTTIDFLSLDVAQTISVANSGRLYLYNQTNVNQIPDSILRGFRIGAKQNDTLNLLISGNEYSAKIVMPNTSQTSSVKSFTVIRSVSGQNSIVSNSTLNFTTNHNILNGESIRILSETGDLPIGIYPNTVYYAITTGLSANQIQIAKTLNDANAGIYISLYGNGGPLTVESRVSDKKSGDIGHPIQYDNSQNQWYICVSTSSSENTIYSSIVSLGTSVLGTATSKTYLYRSSDNRNLLDKVYRVRYVIPAGANVDFARPPSDGCVLQESNQTIDSQVSALYNFNTVTLNNANDLRNPRFIASATWNGSYAFFRSEIPHQLSVGSEIEILNVRSSTNTLGLPNQGYNGTFKIAGITNSKEFYVSLSNNPGTFDLAQTANRNSNLPRFAKKKLRNTFVVYRSQEISKHIPNQQDGVYHLILINSSNSPSVAPFTNSSFSQSIQNLYPQLNRDNPISDPEASVSYALSDPIGQVVVDDTQKSITKETLNRFEQDLGTGINVASIVSNSAGLAHTIYTQYDHGFSGISAVSITNAGAGYGYGSATNLYNAQLVGIGGSHASAAISVNSSGSITSVKIIDGGSAYSIGSTVSVVGVATTTGYSSAVLTITAVENSIGECIEIHGIVPKNSRKYNSVYQINSVPSPNQLIVSSASTITGGIGNTAANGSFLINSGRGLSVNSLSYTNTSGITTIVTNESHGLSVGTKITLGGATNDFYNRDLIVNKINSLNTFETNLGISTVSPSVSGSLNLYSRSISSRSGDIDNLSGRMMIQYAGITTALSAAVNTTNIDEIVISGYQNLNLSIGDCLLIDDEILRIKTTVSSNTVKVFRGVFGTRAKTHLNGSVVRRIRVLPIEFRRNSLIRASNHTFEYVGHGPGNYSTALPATQKRILSDAEQFLSISSKRNGGIVVYNGNDDSGNFYIGNRKVNSATGQEKVFDSPVPTVTGEDPLSGISLGFDAISPLEISVTRSIRVEGGENRNLISEFDGPVIFNQKIVSTSVDGIETNSILIKGDATVSRKYSVGIATPSYAGNPGDIVYNANPTQGSYIGHVYTVNNNWTRFGAISLLPNSNSNVFDSIGIGTTPGAYALNVNGSLRADSLYGDGSNITNISVAAAGWTPVSQGLYNTNLKNVGIGTTNPTSRLTVSGDIRATGVITATNFVGNLIGSATTSTNVIGGIGSVTSLNVNGITTTGTLNVGTSGSLFTVSGIGSIGIGTTDPRRKVDIYGNSSDSSLEITNTNTSGNGSYIGLNASSIPSGREWRLLSAGTSESAGIGTFSIYDATAARDRLTIDNAGNVAITGNLNVPSLNGGQLSGNRNRIINADFNINQRAATFTSGVNVVTYTSDRWYMYAQGTTINGNIINVTTPGTGLINAYRMTGALGNSLIILGQRIESLNSRDLSGRTVTLSFYAASSNSVPITWKSGYAGGGENNFSSTTPDKSGTVNTTPTLTRYFATFQVSSLAITGLSIEFWVNNFNSGTITITGVQLESGPIATPLERRLYGTELQLCLRHFYQGFLYGTAYLPASNFPIRVGSTYHIESMFVKPSVSAPTLTLTSVVYQNCRDLTLQLQNYYNYGFFVYSTNPGPVGCDVIYLAESEL